MKSKIFEFAIIRNPEPENINEKAPPSELLVEPKCILATDEKKALMLAAREIPEEYLEKLDELEIAIRPF